MPGAGSLRDRDRPWSLAAAAGTGAATVGLAFHDGGYFGGATAVVGVAALLLLALRVLLARSPLRGLTPLGLAAATAFVGLTAWTLLSGTWGAEGRSGVEATRTLTYASVFVLFAGLRDGTRAARLLLRATTVALGAVVVVALAARLAPDLLDVAAAQQDTRLSWPLGYWNGLGLAAGCCALLGLALASDVTERAVVRTSAGALVPLGAVAAYLTLSRGALAATLLGLVVLLVVRRGPALFALAATAIPTAAAVAAAASAERLTAPGLTDPATVAQGHRVAGVLVLAVCATLAAQLPAILAGERVHAPRWWSPAVRRGAWAAALAGVAVAFVGAGGPSTVARTWEQATAAGFSAPVADQRDRLASAGSNGRIDQWRVARDAFLARPLTGTGAGTYQETWLRERPLELTARDAHSLPLETAAELGLPGLLLLAGALGLPLAALAGRLRRRPVDPAWQAAAALVVVWLAHAAVDWDWELPAVTLWVVALLGAACARGGWTRRLPPVARLAGVVVLLGVLLLPARVGASQRDLTAALAAFRAGDCTRTVDRALAAAAHAPGRAESFELLAYCDVRLGEPALARTASAQALRRDPGNWQLRYARALVLGATGGDPLPAARAAVAANPLRPEPRALLDVLERAPQRRWAAISRRAPLPLGG